MERRNSEGTTETTISASATAALSPVTVMAGGDGKAGEEELVFAGVVDLLGELGAVRPESDLMAAATVEREGEGSSPCAGTQDDDAAHAVFLTWIASEAGFRAGEQAADVLVVLDDDEQGDGNLNGDEEGRPVTEGEEPGKDRKAGRAKNGCQRNVAAESRTSAKIEMAASAAQGAGDQKYAEAGGDALAAAKAEPDREDVSEDGAERGERTHVERGRAGSKQCAKHAAEHDGCAAFEHVEQEGGRAKDFAAGAQDVGGADVAAAGLADVLMAEEAHEQVPRRNGAEQISRDRNERACKDHNEGEFSRWGLVAEAGGWARPQGHQRFDKT